MQSSRRAVSEVRAGQEPGEGGSREHRRWPLLPGRRGARRRRRRPVPRRRREPLRPADGAPWEPGGFPPSGTRAGASARREEPVSGPRTIADLLRVSQYVDAVVRRGRALPVPARRSSTPTIRRRRCTACSRACRRPRASAGLAAAAGRDDELRRPGRARARGGGPRASTSSGTRPSRTPSARGRFVHRPPDGEAVLIARPNKYTGPADRARAAGDPEAARLPRPRATRDDDSYVITEDSYIDYLVGRRRRRADPDRAAGSG